MTQAFTDSLAHLLAEMERIDALDRNRRFNDPGVFAEALRELLVASYWQLSHCSMSIGSTGTA